MSEKERDADGTAAVAACAGAGADWAGTTWAASERLRHASVADFDAMDRNGGGYVDLREFCEWMAAG